MKMQLNEVKEIIEREYDVKLYARKINTTNTLTQYGKPFIEIRWNTYSKVDGYWMDVRENENAKGCLYTSGYDQIPLSMVLAKLQAYAKPKTQMTLF